MVEFSIQSRNGGGFLKYLFLLIGILLLYVSFTLTQSTNKFLDTAIQTQGSVIALQRDSEGVYFPIFEFTTNDGQPVQIKSSSGSQAPKYHENEAVTILYSPDDPNEARLNDTFSIYGGGIITGGIGFVFILISSFGIYLSRKKSQE
ncbi:DUF3592 domain-containing protein [Photobacterium nomapromontoriensis]|uniref:DUF3592 domain-containing protein n=1 Tax=Photobacterium nomapromontoriensis TaxID=2910237 RepID=UPI003D0BCDDF